MTSASRRNRRTTAWPAPAGRTPTSLLAVALTAAVAAAQAPPVSLPAPAAPPPAAAAAPGRWAPPPPLPSAAAPPYRPLVPADAPPGGRAAAAGPGGTLPAPAGVPPQPSGATRPVLTLQKPAGDTAPRTDPPKASDLPAEPRLPPDKTLIPKPGIPDPKASADPTADPGPPKAVRTGGATDKSKLFRLESPDEVQGRISKELQGEYADRDREAGDKRDANPPEASYFTPPKVEPLSTGAAYQPKSLTYPPGRVLLEPGYVIHRRLYFEDLNSERYGWEVGIAQPALSTLLFWKDTVLWPAKAASFRGERYDTSAGKCLPGSPVPYLVYPEPVDPLGLVVGAGVIVGTSAVLGW